MQFGPVVASKGHLLLLAVVTNLEGTVRALDLLVEGDGPPHLTLGCQADGGGWSRESSAGRVEWRIAGKPKPVPGLSTSEWSQVVEETKDVSALAMRFSECDDLRSAARGPVGAEV